MRVSGWYDINWTKRRWNLDYIPTIGGSNMKIIGLTREMENAPNRPSIHDLIHKPIKEKDKIINYMKKAELLLSHLQSSATF